MSSRILTKAFRAYQEGQYGEALRLYYILATNIGHNVFYGNLLLCLDKINTSEKNISSTCKELIKNSKFDLLSELYSNDIVVSLTSYPARINSVSETIESILSQKFKPGMLVLWLAEEQFPQKEKELPQKLSQLKDKGLSIEWCEDIRSYKKLIPSLQKYPDKVIVTADDDIIYGDNWLAQMVLAYIQDPDSIICHRAHEVLLDEKEGYAPYKYWPKEIRSEHPSASYLFTGCGGVLYPPGSLHKSVRNQSAFSSICPDGDDLWFWSMAVLNGTKIRTVKDSDFKLDFVSGTQETALWIKNVRGSGNDHMLRALHMRHPEIHTIIKSSKIQVEATIPQVSIIIPIFNTGIYLSKCLDSILSQKFKSIEVLCIDDGSSDEYTKNIIGMYAGRDSRIRVIRQQNSGPATARNTGLNKARGTYVAFVDSDDYISEDFIGSLYECAQARDVDISVINKILCIDGDTPPTEKQSGFELYKKIDDQHLISQVIVATGVSCNKLYKREFLLRHEISFLENMRCQSEDNYFSIPAMIAGHKSIALAASGTYYYRQHKDSITKNITPDSFEKSVLVYCEIIKKLRLTNISDKKYWLNIVNQRAIKDLRFAAKKLKSNGEADSLIVENFFFNIDICCIADTNYIVPTMVFLESLRKTKRKTTRISVTVLVPMGSKKDMEVLESVSNSDFFVSVLEIDSTQFDNLHRHKEKDDFCMASPSAMFKFIIPNIFSDLDRILYIDTDLIVRHDLLELFMTSMDNKYLCAVPDLWAPVTDRADIKKFSPYYNSGVMLMNLAKMRNENLPDKLIKAKSNTTNFNLMDQDIFNEVCNGSIKTMDIKFNFLPVCYKRHKNKFDIDEVNTLYGSNYKNIEEIATDPVVAHWAGSDKPWISTSTLFSDEWVEILKSIKSRGFTFGRFDLPLQEQP